MANTNVLELNEAIAPTGGYVYIIIDSVDYKISYENFIKLLPISNFKMITDKDKSANYSRSISTPFKLESIDIYKKSGTPIVSIGTTLGGVDIIDNQTIDSVSVNALPFPFPSGTTFFITITGGTVSINYNYYEISI
jgi:hypothetical protein